jgi:hypothetical protein
MKTENTSPANGVEEKILEILCDLANGLEATALNVRHQIQELLRLAEPSWNPASIKWEQAHGTSGPYERSEDVDSPDFKSLVKDLNQHDGKLAKGGYFFWLFKNGSTVGRKKR